MSRLIHVAAAVIEDGNGAIFLARRPLDKHQGGLWEFPGGKVEPQESAEQALYRELYEEVGITVTACAPLITIPYHYPDKSVLLDVFRVTAFNGEAHGKEGQAVAWVPQNQLGNYTFPAANKPILDAIRLPSRLLITPACDSLAMCVQGVVNACQRFPISWVMLRQKQRPLTEVVEWHQALVSTLGSDIQVTLNHPDSQHLPAASNYSRHLSREQLAAEHLRDAKCQLLGASCHDQAEIDKAVELGCDYITLSPIAPTSSHPGAPALGFDTAQALIAQTPLPVFLLGGMDEKDLLKAQRIGAHGLAAISAWWE